MTAELYALALAQDGGGVEWAAAVWGLLGGIVGAAVGFLGALATFKARLAVGDERLATFKAQRDEFASRVERQIADTERRMERSLTDLKEEYRGRCAATDDAVSKLAGKIDGLVSDSSRRQGMMLQLLAEIANKEGLTNRAGDILPRAAFDHEEHRGR